MSDTPTKVIVNCETGVTEVLPLTAQEISDLEIARAAEEVAKAERDAAEAAKAAAKASAEAKLASLGLTAEEVAALTK
jgi:F0F1-type ATP synthase epsilon subunit